MLIINNYSLTWRWISTTFSDTEVNNFCFSIYHTCWITSRPKSNLICDNIPTKAILFLFGCSEVNNTWLITSELANQHAQKLFTCMAQYILLLLLLLLPLTTIIIIIIIIIIMIIHETTTTTVLLIHNNYNFNFLPFWYISLQYY